MGPFHLFRPRMRRTRVRALVQWRRYRRGGFRREVQPRRQHWFLNEKSGFPFRTPAFCSVSRGQRRFGEKEYRAPSVTPGVALRPRTQGRLGRSEERCLDGLVRGRLTSPTATFWRQRTAWRITVG